MAYAWLKFLLSRRYTITVAGDPIPKQAQSIPDPNAQNNAEREPNVDLDYSMDDTSLNKSRVHAVKKEPFIFIANYSSLINPLYLSLSLGEQNPCYCLTKSQKQISFLLNNINKIILHPGACTCSNQCQTLDVNENENTQQNSSANENENTQQNSNLAKNIEHKDSGNVLLENKDHAKYLKSRLNTVSKAAQSIKDGHSLVLWTSEELQPSGQHVLNNCIAYDLLKQLQENNLALPELFLVRIDGAWGSTFSKYDKSHMPTFFKSLFSKFHLLFLGPFLKRRQIQITFRQHKLRPADLDSPEIFNNLIKNWYTVCSNAALIVPNLSFAPNKHIAMNMPVTIKKLVQNKIISPKKLKVIENPTLTEPEQQIDTFVPNPEEQRKQVQDMPVLAEITPSIIRTPPLLTIQHAITRQGIIVDTDTATFNSRRILLGLAKAISSILTELSASHNIGIALPIGLNSMAAFMGTFDCKPEENRLPVMLDYTLDSKDFEQCTQIAALKFIITSKSVSNLVIPPNITPIYIEDISQTQITKGEVASFMGFAGNTNIDLPAVMLFNKVNDIFKAFTLSHRNLMSCLNDLIHLCSTAPINAHDCSLLCNLPVHTSLGLLNNIIMPLTCGIPIVTVPHTQDIAKLTRIAESYNTNLFIGTSSSLEQILKNALISLPFRYAIIHTDCDMSYIYRNFSQICPNAILMQAFSVNECSSIISLNTRQHPNSIGKIMPNLNYSIHNEKLYVRGASVFSGYLNNDDPRTSIDASSIHNDWLCLDSKFKADDEGFLYNIVD